MLKIVIIMLVVVVVVFVLGLIIKSLAGQKKKEQSAPAAPVDVWPYCAKRLMNESEQMIYQRLKKVLSEYDVFVQVGLNRILEVKRGVSKREWNNRIQSKSVDFVVCNKDSTAVAVVEFDGPSHERKDRKYADETKNKALESAGVKLFRWKEVPEEGKIRALFVSEKKSNEK